MALDRPPEFLRGPKPFFFLFFGRLQGRIYKNFFYVRTVQVAPQGFFLTGRGRHLWLASWGKMHQLKLSFRLGNMSKLFFG